MNELNLFQETVISKDEYIFIKPLCDFFGIDYLNQKKRINNDKILKTEVSKKTHKALFGDKRPRLCVSKRGFIRWIQLIPPSIVHDSLTEKFENYQIAVFDYLYGNAEKLTADKQQAITNYIRLKKLKRLYKLIGNEIRRLNTDFNIYIEQSFVQKKLNF